VLERTLGVPIFQEQVMQIAIVAAGFTPGEADQLRRAMAAWKRKGGLGPFEAKLKDGLRRNGYSEEFAHRIFEQIKGFGEYGFPESHSASFALLAYASAWLKHHEPAAFLCGLLNSQPMGFYAPAQIIQDARRHGVEVRPVDVNQSGWDSCLEDAGKQQPAVRLGLHCVGGLQEDTGRRIEAARREASFQDVPDLAHRAALDRKAFKRLASAGALGPLAGHRHQAYWAALGVDEPWELGAAHATEAHPLLARPTEGQDIVADYASLGFTLGRHPLALLRPQLERRRAVTADRLRQLPNDTRVKVAGIVTHRQRPGSANGVIFVTLEDESGHVNAIVWPDLVERQRHVLLHSRLLCIAGKLQRDQESLHLIASRLEDYTPLLGRIKQSSRDFR
ncbi:MAG TPA: OB-fold nucleic acid binding domain-containing protein, partial [Gammaproteobacteria bacterium]